MYKTDDAVSSLATSVDRGFGEIIQKLGELTDKYGEQSVDLIVRSAALEGINQLSAGFAILFVSVVFWTISRGVKKRWERSKDAIESEGWAVLRAATMVLYLILMGVSLTKLAVASNWYALFDPKVYIAYSVTKRFFLQ